MIYRRRPSPLHAARAAAGCGYCLVLAVAALTLTAPVALGAVAVSVVGAGLAAGVGRELARACAPALGLWLVVAGGNALGTRDGPAVNFPLGHLPRGRP